MLLSVGNEHLEMFLPGFERVLELKTHFSSERPTTAVGAKGYSPEKLAHRRRWNVFPLQKTLV